MRWPDAGHPAQLHVDIAVPDVGDAHGRVTALGAQVLLAEAGHRVYADPVGHPFCLYPGRDDAGRGRIERVVFDCSSPRSLAAFYQALTLAGEAVVDTPDWVEIAMVDKSTLRFAFRRVRHVAPRWPDPTRPQQVHIDYASDGDSEALGRQIVRLGGARLPRPGGGFAYADPAGHPFRL